MENEEDLGIYVCITHASLVPCEQGEHHLISNWAVDVKKILETMEKQ